MDLWLDKREIAFDVSLLRLLGIHQGKSRFEVNGVCDFPEVNYIQ